MALPKAELTRLINRALVELPGATENGIKSQLFDVLTEFFGDSNSWYEDLSVTTVADTQTYTLAPTEDGQVIRLAGVWNSNDSPVSAFMPTFGTLTLRNTPTQAETLTVRVIKNVKMPNTKDDIPIAPEWVLYQYPNYILAGVIGQMMMQQNKSYSDPKMGILNEGKFRDGVAMARVAALRANTVGAQAWSFPQSFKVYSQRGRTGSDRSF